MTVDKVEDHPRYDPVAHAKFGDNYHPDYTIPVGPDGKMLYEPIGVKDWVDHTFDRIVRIV